MDALADMSRISLTAPGEAPIEPKTAQEPSGTTSLFPIAEEMRPSTSVVASSSEAASTTQVASVSAGAASSNTEWKKPKFQKKKRFGGKNQKN
jgi:hypothetical protein